MNNLNSKEIKAEDISNLVWIINSRTDFWDDNTKYLAKEELKRRKISPSEQNKLLKDFLDWDIETEKEWKKIYLDSKSEESEFFNLEKAEFSIRDKILILITAPFTILRNGIGPDLFVLYSDKKMKMFWEKLLFLIFGILIWFSFIYFGYRNYENNRLKEIENIDISDWKEKHGYE